MKRLALSVALSLFASTAFAAAPVATLASQEGVVMVNQGEEFVTATEAQALKPGDSVMVMEGGAASVVFNDGCALPLESGSLVVIPLQSTCSGAIAEVRRIGPSYAQVVGSNTARWETAEWLAFAGTIIVIGAIVAHDDDPVSP